MFARYQVAISMPNPASASVLLRDASPAPAAGHTFCKWVHTAKGVSGARVTQNRTELSSHHERSMFMFLKADTCILLLLLRHPLGLSVDEQLLNVCDAHNANMHADYDQLIEQAVA